MIHIDIVEQAADRLEEPVILEAIRELKRLRAHVIAEYRSCEISEGRASELLDIDRHTLRLFSGVYQTPEGPIDATRVDGANPNRKIKLVREQVLDAARELAQGSEFAPPSSEIAARVGIKPGSVDRHISTLRKLDAWPFRTRFTGSRNKKGG